MKKMLVSTTKIINCITLAVVIALVAGCSIKLVADYDAAVSEAIISTAKDVDTFYGQLLETARDERDYKKCADRYLEIEIALRSLVMRNKIRPLNQESTHIAETILEKWLKYKQKHKDTNTYKDVLARQHRKRFTKLFTAMAVAEEAKRLTAEPNE